MRIPRAVENGLRRIGYEAVGGPAPAAPPPPDLDPATLKLFEAVKPYTLTSLERVAALRAAVIYICQAEVPGAIVECGIWRGGSMLAVAHTLVELGDVGRDLYLFDTFDAMPPPGDEDVDIWGRPASELHDAATQAPAYSYLPRAEVEDLLLATGYPPERMHFIAGMVEETLPGSAPDQIALCRLDTDWYVSTSHEMRCLFPRIAEGGVLMVDDYGHYKGARKAVDEYFSEAGLTVLLHRIDYTGRLLVVSAAMRSALQAHADGGGTSPASP